MEQPDASTTSNADAIAALEHFVVDNDDLLALESLIGKFNIFDALGVARAEIRHSNFLSFILDPAESHGQSQLFLRALLMDLLKTAPPALRPLSPIDIDGADLRGVEVRREWNNIDLLVTARQPALVVVVENKVDSHEHSNQLGRYKQTIARHYPDARPLYVFLTPDGSEPSEEEWVPYSYTDLHRVLSRVRHTYESAIGDDVLVFLDHYLNLIGTRFMNDPNIDALCQRIYKNHRQALQLIYDRVGTPASGTIAEVETCLRDDHRWHVFYRAADKADFVPKDWTGWLPPLGLDSKDQPQSWLVMRFEAFDAHLDFFVEVRRMKDLNLRRAIIDVLLADGAKFGFVRKQKGEVKVKDFYTRVSSREKVLTWPEDTTPDPATVHAAVKKKLDEIHPKLGGIPAALAPVLNAGA
jgi:hypothetical protein